MKRNTSCCLWCLFAVVTADLSYAQDRSVDPAAPKAAASEPADDKQKSAPLRPTSVKGLKAVTTESGLKYWDIKVGKGERLLPDATVIFEVTAWLSDGTVFENSVGKNKPAKAYIGRLVKGLAEGIASMRVGGKRLFEIPPKLGHGERGSAKVPPNETLLYEVELIGVEQPPQPTSVEGLTPVTTESGLKYYDFKVGNGAQPLPGGKVKVHYGAWVAGGRLIRSTLKQPGPVNVSLDGVCDGWAEGIGSMKVGGKRQIHVPPELGPGEDGGDRIPPNSAVIFEVELFDIVPPPHLEPIAGVEPVLTESGLKYWDVKKGDGPAPQGPTSKVTLRYTGWLGDGHVFDSTAYRGGQLAVRFDRLVKGLQEGIGSMKVGGLRWIEVPPQLGFGDRGHRSTDVGPGETLMFKIELLDVGPPRHIEAVDGVQPVITASGLKYHDIKTGNGPSPGPTSTVTIEYTGWLTDGTVFLSTDVDGEPLTVGFERMIEGLKEGIGSMKVGGERWMEIPPELGFGDAGHPPNNVGPGETLIFEVRLLDVQQ